MTSSSLRFRWPEAVIPNLRQPDIDHRVKSLAGQHACDGGGHLCGDPAGPADACVRLLRRYPPGDAMRRRCTSRGRLPVPMTCGLVATISVSSSSLENLSGAVQEPISRYRTEPIVAGTAVIATRSSQPHRQIEHEPPVAPTITSCGLRRVSGADRGRHTWSGGCARLPGPL